MSDPKEFLEKKSQFSNTPSKKEIKDEILGYLMSEYYINHHPKEEQQEQWFQGYLKNYIYKNDIDYKSLEFQNELRHIVDYLGSPQAPRKFYSMTWEVAKQQTSEWDIWLAKRVNEGDDPDGSILLHDLDKGWSAVQLVSSKALSYEGGVMQNCVGTYNQSVQDGVVEIVSIRDKNNNSHMTIEHNIRKNEIVQVQGKQNQLPVAKHQIFFREYLTKAKRTATPSILRSMGVRQLGYEYIIIENDKMYEDKVVQFLDKNPNYNGGGILDISNTSRIKNISGCWDEIIAINSQLENIDNIKAKSVEITKAPMLKRITGDVDSLSVSFSNIEKLNKELSVSTLYCKNLPNIKKINTSDTVNIDLNNLEQEINLSPGQYQSIVINKTKVKGLDDIKANSFKLFGYVMGDIPLANFNNIEVEQSDIASFDELNLPSDFSGIWKINNMPNLKSLENIDLPDLSLDISMAPVLELCSYNKLNLLSLKKCPNIQEFTRNQINVLTYHSSFNGDVKMKRNRIKQIQTNQPELFKGAKSERGKNRSTRGLER